MRVPAVVAEQVDPVPGADDDVLIAVAIEIGDEHWPGRIVLQWSRQQRAAIVKAATAVVMEQRRALRPRDNEVEPAVIVVIEERRSGRAARARERRRRRAGVAGEGAVAAVVPETCAGGSRDEHVERTVVVIITDCHGAGGLPSPWPEGGCDLGVTPDPIVMEQRIAAILAADDDVAAPIIVEVAERGVAASPRDPVRIRNERECPVEVVAIDGE